MSKISLEKATRITNVCTTVILVTTLIIISYMLSIYFYSQRKLMEIREYEPTLSLTYDLSGDPYSNSEVKIKLDTLYGSPWYFYREKNLKNCSGATELIFRCIYIDNVPNLPPWAYTYVLSHELTHLVNCCADEAYTEYNGIIKLYESGDPYFMEVAKWATMLNILSYGDNDEYECGYYLQEYFNNLGGVAND